MLIIPCYNAIRNNIPIDEFLPIIIDGFNNHKKQETPIYSDGGLSLMVAGG